MTRPPSTASSDFVAARYSQLLARCRDAGVAFYDDAGVAEHLQRVLLASDFAFDCLDRDPSLLAPSALMLMSDPRPADTRDHELRLGGLDEATQLATLRRFRKRESLRLIWRDVNGSDDVAATLAGASALAEVCIEAALRAAEITLTVRHGVPRDSAGLAQRLVVFGLGKLGGGELNFSSDVDLILAFAENGQTDGSRSVDNEAYFARLGQQLVKLLAEVTSDGFGYRVDLRLRPFGSAGRVALSFAAMEQYYQREGRDWERYAWIKARPVAGDIAGGERLIETLRPFIYRRYLDYTAFAGLREMKAMIDAEVVRKDLAQHLKLGPGGIREIEFIVQLLQLIRGGREPALRVRGLLPALTACEQLGLLPGVRARRLRESYGFLRRLENRVQMLRDEQTHELPQDLNLRARFAAALGYPDWAALIEALDAVRATVSEEFAALMAAPRSSSSVTQEADAWQRYWRSLDAGAATPADLAGLGVENAEARHFAFVALLQGQSVRGMSARARACFDRLLPILLHAAVESAAPDACLDRLVRLLSAIVKRPAYLSLLDEQSLARERLVRVFAASAYLAELIIAHPLLLDDLFDARLEELVPDRSSVSAELTRRLANADDSDTEGEIEILQEEKHSAAFRLGLASLAGRVDAVSTSARLADLAEAMVAAALDLAERDALRQYGAMQGRVGAGTGIAVLGYGSLGGTELGFGSDLDLVFVYDASFGQKESCGPKVLDGMRYYARLAQRVVHLLTTLTRNGRLYEVDVRLRPDGGKGLLVSSLDAFADYQRERAWTWEHQALVRARFVAGDAALGRRFAAVREEILARPRDADKLRADISSMRARWRTELDRSDVARLDLKQGAGGLVDIEFLLQSQVLLHANLDPELLQNGNSANLISTLAATGRLAAEDAFSLADAHSHLLAAGLACTLDARPRLVPRTPELEARCAQVLRVARVCGLDFGSD